MKTKAVSYWSICVGVLVSCLVVSKPGYAEDELLQMMLDKARYLQSLGKSDQSTQAWRKVLVASPNNTEALLWLGMSEAYAGNLDKATEYAERFSQAGGKPKTLEALKRAIEMGPPDAFQLDRARKLAQAGKAEEAVAAYKNAFHGIEPTGHLALEYYQTLSAVPDAWESARAGLEKLVTEFPDQPVFQYAYARHLSYRESTRREAIKRLERLVADRTVGKDAEQDLRQAVIWLQVKPSDEALLNRLARQWPDNKVIAKKLKELRWELYGPDERDRSLKTVYQALEKGDLDGAEEMLKKLYKKGSKDAEVLAALGLLRLKQERFDDALAYLEKATRLEPEKKGQWSETLTSAKYWSLIRRSETLKKQNNLKEAELVLRKAVALKPAAINPRNALADVLAKLGRPEKAREMYEEVLKRDPENVDAKFGLVFVLVELGERDKALALANEVTRKYPEKGVAFAHIQAQEFADQALAAKSEDVQVQARLKLEDMLAVDPANPWIRLDLARVYRLQGEREKARSLLDGLLLSHPDLPAALYARALLYEEEKQYSEGLRILEKIPPQSRSFDMRKLQNRLWVRVQTQRAQIYAERGQIKKAHEILEEVTPVANVEREFIGPLAKAWMNIGDEEKALSILRQDTSNDIDLKFLYLTALLETGQDAEVELVMSQLESRDLSDSQRQALEDMYIGYAIRRANIARERGDYAQAYEYLSTLQAKYPDNSDVIVALATLHAAVGDNQQAFSRYIDVFAKNPQDLDALAGAVGIAMTVGDNDVAMLLAQKGLSQEPDSAQANALIGRVYRALGDDEQAVKHLERALELETGRPVSPGMIKLQQKDLPRLKLDRLQDDGYSGSSAESSSLYLETASVLGLLDEEENASVSNDDDESQLARQIRDDLNALYSQHSPAFKGGMAFRYRAGQEGLSRLADLEIPLEFVYSPQYKGRLVMRATPVLVDAGDISAGDLATLRRYGTGAFALAPPAKSIDVDGSGVALTADYDTRNWHFDLGTSPLGFVESSLVGGVHWKPVVGSMQLSVGFSRQMVTDSVLSYAGLKDVGSSRIWGGVSDNSVEFSSGYDLGGQGVYGTLSYGVLTGRNVASNNKLELSAGFYKDLLKQQNKNIKGGIHLTAFGYNRNLSQFTYGHGGYFSPRYYMSISVPVNIVGYNGPISYALNGSVGLHSFDEDDADYFPDNPDMQEQLELLAATQPDIGARYRGNSEFDFNYGLAGNVEYRMSPQLSVGAKFSISKAQNYEEFGGLLYASFWAVPQRNRIAPEPVVPFYLRDNYD